MLWRSFLHTSVTASIMAGTVFLGLFDKVVTKDGFHNYAENPWTFMNKISPWFAQIPTPGNIAVNAGYFIVAFYWLNWTSKEHSQNNITSKQAYMFYIFAWSSLLYAPIQLIRIITQNHRFAILDQWYTLPIFAWVTVWGYFISNGWKPLVFVSLMLGSCLSYCFALVQYSGFEDKGFDFALSIHIILAVKIGVDLCHRYFNKQILRTLILSILCCAGFVCLKLSDQYLGKMHTFFNVLSGHFWSKIADFLQIHFVFRFFQYVTLQVNASRHKSI